MTRQTDGTNADDRASDEDGNASGLDTADRAWLEALRGGAGPAGQGLPADEQRAAASLGAAYRESALRSASIGVLPNAAQRQARLLAHARAAGLLPPAPAAPRGWLQALGLPTGPWRMPATGFALALAGVVAAALWPVAPEPQDETVLRGADALPPVTAADPRAARDAALARLRGAGVEAASFEAPGSFGLEVEVPATPDAAAAAALREVFGEQPPRGSQQRLYSAPSATPYRAPALPASPESATKPAQ